MPQPDPRPQPRPQRPRFIAPHFIEIEGSADMPGAIRRACAFTTVAPGWPRNPDGATHYHRCTLTSDTGRWKDGGVVGWRTESWPVSLDRAAPEVAGKAGEHAASLLPPAAVPAVAEGHAADLMQAIASALGAAYAPLPGPQGGQEGGVVQCVAPAFVEMEREAGLPRIWICSHLNAQGALPPEQPWTHLQTVLVREWPGRTAARPSAAPFTIGHLMGKPAGQERFQVELETLPFAAIIPAQGDAEAAAPQPLRWWAPTLEKAMRGALEHLYGTGCAPRPLGAGLEGWEPG